MADIPDDAVAARAQGWRTLAALHARIEDALERALREHGLSVSEYTVLDALSRQPEGMYLRMSQLAGAVVLSQSATTRLITRLEERGLVRRDLCPDDRRGIIIEVTEAGGALLAETRPTHAAALAATLDAARTVPELSPLVDAFHRL
ncbi:MarR family transcriptional regulator [Pseudonocardiaceae bacterium YIM PH 21723]|nr:MarR family transcriptional regulator [Pseudonocardiaceae bacterium YIM PH 21723]